MARDDVRSRSPALNLRGESGNLLKAADVAEKIENFEATSEGTLRSVRGPCRLMPTRLKTAEDGGFETNHLGRYGTMHGIFHTLLMQGTRDVLLVHTGDEVRVFDGLEFPIPTNEFPSLPEIFISCVDPLRNIN